MRKYRKNTSKPGCAEASSWERLVGSRLLGGSDDSTSSQEEEEVCRGLPTAGGPGEDRHTSRPSLAPRKGSAHLTLVT